MTHIRNILDEPIEGQEEYSIIGFQTGTTYVFDLFLSMRISRLF